jgi:predicted dehydrogenase
MRVGIFGWGRWSPNLYRNIAKHASVSWICDPSASVATTPVPHVREPVWDSVDAVIIATPIETHAELVGSALSHGVHVLCEKPLTTSRAEAVKLSMWATEIGVTLMMSCPWLYHPGFSAVASLVPSLDGPLWYRAERTSWDERHLDPIADLLPHDVGILQKLTRHRIAEVSALRNGPSAAVTMITAGGVLATADYTYCDSAKLRSATIGCRGGSMRIDSNVPGPEPLDAMCAEFVRCCKTGDTPVHGSDMDAIDVATVIEAAHESILMKRVVAL